MKKIRRIHLFEFEDLTWFPDVIREGMTDFLRHMIKWLDFYGPAATIIKDLLNDTHQNKIVELAAGGGGGIEKLIQNLSALECKPQIVLTDLFPNVIAYEDLKQRTNGQVDFIAEAIDAANVSSTFTGIRLMFSAFHHFKPETAKAILEDAARKKVTLGIFDSGTKNILTIAGILLLQPFLFFFLTPFFTPFRWSRLLFTYLLPLIPLCTIWDGSVSVLRFYSLKQMQLLTDGINNESYLWQVGSFKNTIGTQVNYIIGYPKAK